MRRPLIATLLGLLISFPAAGALGSPRVPGAQLLPNLWTMAPTGFHIVQNRTRRVLRLTNATVNVGAGPVQLDPKRRDCNGDGDLTNDRTGIQRVFDDVDGDGMYDPSIDTSSTTRVVGCFRFDERHAHWHFRDYASYELVRPSDGTVVASHDKVGFCLLDTQRPYPGIPGSPVDPAYATCQPDRSQGLSPGWSDIYLESLPGQLVNVTGVPDGRYCFRATTDPADRILESDEGDNTASMGLRLNGDGVTPLSGIC